MADDAASAIRFIAGHARPGDTCLLLGAGDVGDLAGPLIDFFAGPGREARAPEPHDGASAHSLTGTALLPIHEPFAHHSLSIP